ncbi:hypothetical protein I2483_13920 [Sporosarcina sp. E16_3]|uniref:hypothetical protein n=1 Tax=Sporosarcina sp. E16_3 TaxID=2789293 RepID=UPI001A924B24|nr:hypothetical protein [Sporosarcina sp. E16_3]MBO0602761.1 hypothetical protein [Sporosarcina sp. E16_3]
MRKLDYKPSGKKAWYKRWKVWGGVFVAVIVIGMIVPEVEEPAVVAPVAKAKTQPVVKPSPAVKTAVAAKEPIDRSRVTEMYVSLIAESEGVIVNIEPEEDYEIINVRLSDDFAYAPVDLRQAFVDEFGGKIENSTRALAFEGRGSKDFVYVYFINTKGEHVVDTSHFDKGWTAK